MQTQKVYLGAEQASPPVYSAAAILCTQCKLENYYLQRETRARIERKIINFIARNKHDKIRKIHTYVHTHILLMYTYCSYIYTQHKYRCKGYVLEHLNNGQSILQKIRGRKKEFCFVLPVYVRERLMSAWPERGGGAVAASLSVAPTIIIASLFFRVDRLAYVIQYFWCSHLFLLFFFSPRRIYSSASVASVVGPIQKHRFTLLILLISWRLKFKLWSVVHIVLCTALSLRFCDRYDRTTRTRTHDSIFILFWFELNYYY